MPRFINAGGAINMMALKTVEIQFNKIERRKIEIEKEGAVWVVTDPVTHVSSYGDTKQEAVKAFEEALSVYYEENPPIKVKVNLAREGGSDVAEAKTVVRA